MPLTPGTRLGPYEILSAIGAGGMGEVYKARDTRLDRTVALKVLPPELSSDPDRSGRFEREARAVAALDHPHICGIYDVGEANGLHFLVMPHLDGQTLAARLEKGPLPLDQTLKIAGEIADALDKAHRHGIVHRDLKPANIMLTKAGAKLLDFGLAKLKGPAVPLSMTAIEQATTTGGPKTASGTILGTVHYMSPEQVEGREADARSDIWALGVVIYEMATGARPFDGESAASIIGAILRDTPAAISSREPLSPPAVDHVVERCLDKDPDERWQSAGDIKRELTWIARASGTPTPTAINPHTLQRQRIDRWLPWSLTVLLFAFVVLGRITSRPSPVTPAVVRLDLNMPPGVEVAMTNSPQIALSNDGTRVAFSGGVGGLRRLYVRRLDETDATAMRGTDGLNICFFSADGRSLGFVSSDRNLKRVSLADGLVTTVVADADYQAGGGAWGTDDRIVFVRDGTLWQVPATGGSARQLTFLDRSKSEIRHSWPTIVSENNAILFTTVTEGTRTAMRIDALTPSTGERHTVVESGRYPLYAASGHLAFFRDDALLAAPFDPHTLAVTGPAVAVLENIAVDQLGVPMVASANSGSFVYVRGTATRRLVWVSRSGVEENINATPRPYQNPRLAPDGHRIIIEVAGGDLWIHDTSRATFRRLTSGNTIGNTFAVWTPDGRRVIFRTVTGLWVMDADGGGRLQLIPGTSVSDIPTSVSADGQTLAFIRQNTDTSGDIYTLSLTGDPKPRGVVATPGYDGGAQFAPDGRWMSYVSNESGQFEVYVQPYPSPGGKVLVSTQGGTHPKWNRNGKELFYRNLDKMMVVDVSTRGNQIVLSQPRVLFEQRYAFGSAQTVANFDVSADGQRFVMVRDDSSSGRLNFVLNWFEELKARVPTK